ncbi:hypothetical protein F4777DRAFT_13913 [Nemania sp. FL0916]|nr:hypothetical protein F4777DRAFT_13913 [Nemania sp. FL0916]
MRQPEPLLAHEPFHMAEPIHNDNPAKDISTRFESQGASYPIADELPSTRRGRTRDANDSDSSPDTVGRRHRRVYDTSKADVEKLKAAEKHFTRENGVIYVADELWAEYRNCAYDAHIYMSPAGIKIVRSRYIIPDSDSGSDSDISTKPILSERPEHSAWSTLMTDALPGRLRIVNELLLADISDNCIKWTQLLNHDHVAPFRTLIPFEKIFRERHSSLETSFKALSHSHPDHPAVLRNTAFLPSTLAYPLPAREHEQPNDEIGLSRVLLDGYRALIHVLDNDLNQLVSTHRNISLGTVEQIPFSHLWHLFRPGQEIIVKIPKPEVYRVLQVTGGRRSLSTNEKQKETGLRSVSDLAIDCFSLDYNGEHFGPVACKISIKPYDGFYNITDLAAYPLCYDTTKWGGGTVREYLITSGRKFQGYTTASHKRYRGLTARIPRDFETVDEVDTDVIIDFDLAYRHSPTLVPSFNDGVIEHPTEEEPGETYSTGVNRFESEGTSVSTGSGVFYDDHEFIRSQRREWLQNTDLLSYCAPESLTDDHFVLLPGRVWGYVLLNRKWRPLHIHHIYDIPKVIPGESDGFKKLVLPNGHKKIVRALINTHARKVDSELRREFDVVTGKGRGLIILLHGAPGVGKTSTAECVAANAGRPLFPITCGDIGGETAQDVERNLENYFELARKWNCVLLLDEADVFLAARERGNIAQNSLVSVFLRVLEYYPGILILTTNRVGSFDEAIKSRVHCALYYPKLNKEQTILIWRMNIQTLEEQNQHLEPNLRVHFDKQEIESFAERHWRKGNKETRWNGRQIKNAFQTAVSLAQWDHHQAPGVSAQETGPTLKVKHFRKVAIASKHFDRYLIKTRRGDEDIARELALRDDSLNFDSESDFSDQSSDSESDDQRAKSGKSSLKKKDGKKARRKESRTGKKSGGSSRRKQRTVSSSSEELSESEPSRVSGSEDSSEETSEEDEPVSRKSRGASKKKHDKRR